jgi:hypothetical protein
VAVAVVAVTHSQEEQIVLAVELVVMNQVRQDNLTELTELPTQVVAVVAVVAVEQLPALAVTAARVLLFCATQILAQFLLAQVLLELKVLQVVDIRELLLLLALEL